MIINHIKIQQKNASNSNEFVIFNHLRWCHMSPSPHQLISCSSNASNLSHLQKIEARAHPTPTYISLALISIQIHLFLQTKKPDLKLSLFYRFIELFNTTHINIILFVFFLFVLTISTYSRYSNVDSSSTIIQQTLDIV